MNVFGYTSIAVNSISKVFGVRIIFEKTKNQHKWLEEYNIDTVLDIGANEGQFLGEWLKILPNASFYSFEPLPKIFGRLQNKYGHKNNVILHNVGLGSNSGQILMNECDFDPSSSILEMTDIHKNAFPITSLSEPKHVMIKKLDDINITGENILIKIDTQGYESEVIKGGLETINKAKICIIETSFYQLYVDGALYKDIYVSMLNLGFTYCGSYDQIKDPNDGKTLQQDAIFIKK